jgi:glycosyltransferase involved in cell wall biosynthesis
MPAISSAMSAGWELRIAVEGEALVVVVAMPGLCLHRRAGERHRQPDYPGDLLESAPALARHLAAQAAGVRVVATLVGGIRETVIEGETGWLVPPRDARTLALYPGIRWSSKRSFA